MLELVEAGAGRGATPEVIAYHRDSRLHAVVDVGVADTGAGSIVPVRETASEQARIAGRQVPAGIVEIEDVWLPFCVQGLEIEIIMEVGGVGHEVEQEVIRVDDGEAPKVHGH